jgi:hypothetical protein
MKLRNIVPKLMKLDTIAPESRNNMLGRESVTVLDVNNKQR